MQDRLSRRTAGGWIGALALTLSGSIGAQPTFPQPGKPIRIIVGLTAGGTLDSWARVLAQRLTELTGVAVLVENRPGASMILSVQELMRSAPDGHTLLFAPSAVFAQNPHTLANLPYDPFKDFTPITLATRGPLVLTVHASVPARTVPELIAWAKARPGKLDFANFGTGSASHVYAAAFAKSAGIEVVHVPYKGTADASRDLLGGQVQAFFDAAASALQNAKTGRVRLIGVAARTRSAVMPDVPTISEQGLPGIDLTSWTAVVGPAGMPANIVAKVNELVTQALLSPQVSAFIAAGAYEVAAGTPAQLAAEISQSYEQWGLLVRQLGIAKQ